MLNTLVIKLNYVSSGLNLDANYGKAEQIGLKRQNLDIIVVSQAKLKRADQEKILKLP